MVEVPKEASCSARNQHLRLLLCVAPVFVVMEIDSYSLSWSFIDFSGALLISLFDFDLPHASHSTVGRPTIFTPSE
jgi:hypothetical protein